MISSAVALLGVCGYSGYAPSKFALRGLAEVLRPELEKDRIYVTLVMPPDTSTPQLERERGLRPAATATFSGFGGEISAEAVAANVYRAVRARHFLALPSNSLWLLHLFGGFAGPFLRRYQARLVRRERGG